jgi:predicted ATPase/signal transduction histidine kinase
MKRMADFAAMELVHQSAHLRTFLAREAATGNLCWLKTTRSAPPSAAEREKLLTEIGVSGKLAGAGFPRYAAPFRMGEDGRLASLAEADGEDGSGLTLRRWIGQREAPLSVKDALRVALALAGMLKAFHQNRLVHNGLSPDSLWLNPVSFRMVPLDCGAAREPGAGASDIYASLADIPQFAYMSPEQTGHLHAAVDFRSDYYVFGLILYELLTGLRPYRANSPQEWLHAHVAGDITPPRAVRPDIPSRLEDIVMRCLARLPEARYQNAFRLHEDLEALLHPANAGGRGHGHVHANGPADPTGVPGDVPTLGERDECPEGAPAFFQVAERFAGRDRELEQLARVLPGAGDDSSPGLVLVSGEPGIGKSALIRELERRAGPSVLFVCGKFDRVHRGQPFSAWIDAFRHFVDRLLLSGEEELAAWKAAILAELEPHAEEFAALLPQIERIIGDRLKPEGTRERLPAVNPEYRFLWMTERFFRIFPRMNRPIAVVLDDWQWADGPSVSLLRHVVDRVDRRFVRCIVISRDKDDRGLDTVEALLAEMPELRLEEEAGRDRVFRMKFGPLDGRDIAEWTAASFGRKPEELAELAAFLAAASGGNPLMVREYLHLLYAERLVWFDMEDGRWAWDMFGVVKAGTRYRANQTADLLIDRLGRLPESTLRFIKAASCMGTRFDCAAVAGAIGISLREAEEAADELARLGLIAVGDDGACTFAHDRILQASHDLLDDEEKGRLNARLGKILLERPNLAGTRLFAVADHLNRGVAHLGPEDRLVAAETNRTAGHLARQAAAFSHAYRFYRSGCDLLPEDGWTAHYRLTYELKLGLAECAFLLQRPDEAGQWFAELERHARPGEDRTQALVKQIMLFARAGLLVPSISRGLAALAEYGLHVPRHPSRLRILAEWLRQRAAGRNITRLKDAPPAENERMRQVMAVIASLGPATYLQDPDLMLVLAMLGNRITFRHGIFPNSGICLVAYAAATLQMTGNCRMALAWGETAWHLAEKYGTAEDKCYTAFMYGAFLHHWGHPPEQSEAYLAKSIQLSEETGDLAFLGYGSTHLIASMLIRGVPLARLSEEVERYGAWTDRLNDPHFARFINLHRAFLRNLQGGTDGLFSFDHGSFREKDHADSLQDNRQLFDYLLCKIQVCYLHGDLEEAARHAGRLRGIIGDIIGTIVIPEAEFFCCLIALAQAGTRGRGPDRAIVASVRTKLKQFSKWEQGCPTLYAHKTLLIRAELARLAGADGEAAALYERAADAAAEAGCLKNEAIIHECAARFHQSRGNRAAFLRHLAAAWRGYQNWGAHAKAGLLMREYPELLDAAGFMPDAAAAPGGETGTGSPALPLEASLDIAAVLEAAQAISGELVLEDLLRNLLSIALRHTGGDRAVLLLQDEGEWRVAAQGKVTAMPGSLECRIMEGTPLSAFDGMARTVVQYAIRTGDMQVLDRAWQDERFGRDPYLAEHRVPSVLCLPIMLRGEMTGILYLENGKSAGVFTPARNAVLQLLSSQIAISVQNALLYERLREENVRLAGSVSRAEWSLSRSRRETAAARIENAILEERNRIAGDIHDMIDHAMTGVLAQIEAGIRLIEMQQAGQAVEKLEHARQLLRDEVNNVRRSLSMLKDETGGREDMVPDLQAFLERTREYAGVEVEADLESGLELSPAQKYVLYRTLQEGITNGIRHGRADRFDFALRRIGRGIEFVLRDNGRGTDKIKYGLGLSDMRDRVREMGGAMEMDTSPGNGCGLIIRLPDAAEGDGPV